MPRPPFWNDNAKRAYPFTAAGSIAGLLDGVTPVVLPHETIVDFGCLLGSTALFDHASHSVVLDSITRVGDTLTFRFASDAPGLTGRTLDFERDLHDARYTSSDADVVLAEDDEQCATPLVWQGHLTTGPLGPLVAVLPDGAELTDLTLAVVEPALLQNLRGGWVNSINLANATRTTATPAPACDDSSSSGAGVELVVAARCLTGPLALIPGYNCDIRQDAFNSLFVISAVVGAGDGEPCVEVPTHPDEEPPDEGPILTGGPTCNEVISSINGLAGPVVRLIAGRGVTITPGEHLLTIALDLSALKVCQSSDDSST